MEGFGAVGSKLLPNWLPFVDIWVPLADNWLPFADSWLPLVDNWLPLTEDPPLNAPSILFRPCGGVGLKPMNAGISRCSSLLKTNILSRIILDSDLVL